MEINDQKVSFTENLTFTEKNTWVREGTKKCQWTHSVHNSNERWKVYEDSLTREPVKANVIENTRRYR